MALATLPPFVQLVMAHCLEAVLQDVGDVAAGQWTEPGPHALHCKRRVSAAEWGGKPWGMDFRGTSEGARLLAECKAFLPDGYHE